jgi:hypothetical protein
MIRPPHPSPLRRQGPIALAISGTTEDNGLGPCLRRGDGI